MVIVLLQFALLVGIVVPCAALALFVRPLLRESL